MKYGLLKLFILVALMAVLLVGTTGCDETSIIELDFIWASIKCQPDGNDAHVNATLLRKMCMFADAVGTQDASDWYMLPLPGDVEWEGNLVCITNREGLRVGFYADTGSGLALVKEVSPSENSEGDLTIYTVLWETPDLLGLSDPGPFLQAGNYYIRVTYYTYFPGKHPYFLMGIFQPESYLGSTHDSAPAAKELPPGIMYTGRIDDVDSENWFKFEIAGGQSGTGIIAIEPATFGRRLMGTLYPDPPTFSVKANLRNPDTSLITTILVDEYKPSYFDLSNFGPLAPGEYYVNLALYTSSPEPQEFDYTIFNHALAPGDGMWAADGKEDAATADPMQENVPVSGSVYWPRDVMDYFKFNSPGYFIGDINVDAQVVDVMIECDVEGVGYGGSFMSEISWIPGLGYTNRFAPIPPGDIDFYIADRGRLYTPTEYELTLYPHGAPTEPLSGHDTWEDAIQLEVMTGDPEGGFHQANAPGVVFHLKPGGQELYFTTLTVPEDEFLVGYYEIYGSRTDYRVYMGKLGPGGVPVWAPALTPDAEGKLTIDMDYDYLSDAGTYFLKFQLQPSAQGQTRIFLDNYSRITGCYADTNNDYFDAKGIWLMESHDEPRYGVFCPPDDIQDWYTFSTNNYNPQYGPNTHLKFRGSVQGMNLKIYDKDMIYKGEFGIPAVGETLIIDFDELSLQPLKPYYIKISAKPQEERVQIYELEYRWDKLTLRPAIYRFMQEEPMLGLQDWPMISLDSGLDLREAPDD